MYASRAKSDSMGRRRNINLSDLTRKPIVVSLDARQSWLHYGCIRLHAGNSEDGPNLSDSSVTCKQFDCFITFQKHSLHRRQNLKNRTQGRFKP